MHSFTIERLVQHLGPVGAQLKAGTKRINQQDF
jgi:hypothetical protein